MTTERSGMSLEQVRGWHENMRKGSEIAGNDKGEVFHRGCIAAIDAHLSRDAVVSTICTVCGGDCSAANPPVIGCPLTTQGIDAAIDTQTSVNAAFAARHAAVPDELHFYMTYTASETESYKVGDKGLMIDVHHEYAKGWNACREAMLAQLDGGTKAGRVCGSLVGDPDIDDSDGEGKP